MPEMFAPGDLDFRRGERHALLAGSALCTLTSIHHVYGAIRYGTPWRYHALVIAAVTVLVMLGALSVSRARRSIAAGRAAWWVFWGVNAAVVVLVLGAFEGAYNHVLKDALYFGGVPTAVMRMLFPEPTYEMPNDWFFEVTGVLQVVPAAFAAVHLGRLLRQRPRIASAR